AELPQVELNIGNALQRRPEMLSDMPAEIDQKRFAVFGWLARRKTVADPVPMELDDRRGRFDEQYFGEGKGRLCDLAGKSCGSPGEAVILETHLLQHAIGGSNVAGRKQQIDV